MRYFIRSPWWLRQLYKGCLWQIPTKDKKIYLTFDDGPHPSVTPYVLDRLKEHNARATFFCVGKNVEAYPEVYKRILEEGHAVGNHTFDHLDGWATPDKRYLDNIAEARRLIVSDLYRPPYGRITRFQLRQLAAPGFNLKTVMWSILSGDFDKSISGADCMQNVVLRIEPGSIVVFHDSEKAYERLSYALPAVLKYFSSREYSFDKITSA